jgi:hypothetical protein
LVACGKGDAMGIEGTKARETRSVANDSCASLGCGIVYIPNEFAAETSVRADSTAGARTGARLAGGGGLVVELVGGAGRHAGLVVVGEEAGLAGEAEGGVVWEAVETVAGAGAAEGGGGVPVLLLGAAEDA